VVHAVRQAPTATQVSASPNPVSRGHSLTLSATVVTLRPGRGVPTGKVQFVIDGTKLSPQVRLVDGTATLTFTVALGPGSHLVRAFYVGTNGFGASSSASYLLYVK
jgi:hypothetical protein